MKVEFITRTESKKEKYDYRDRIIIKVNGRKVFDVRDGEPEDSNLSRNFNDCYSIIDLIEFVYDTGKIVEDAEIKIIQSDDI